MRSQHIWTEKNEDGIKREVRATKFGGVWKWQAKVHGEELWTYYDVPLMEDLLALQDIIERKYRRRRATAEDVVAVKKLVADRQRDE
jgi:predicted metalloprotease